MRMVPIMYSLLASFTVHLGCHGGWGTIFVVCLLGQTPFWNVRGTSNNRLLYVQILPIFSVAQTLCAPVLIALSQTANIIDHVFNKAVNHIFILLQTSLLLIVSGVNVAIVICWHTLQKS